MLPYGVGPQRQRAQMSEKAINFWEFVIATAAALALGAALSVAAVYALDRYMGGQGDPPTAFVRGP